MSALLLVVLLAADPAVWSPSHQMSFRAVADVQPSPDAQWVVWTEKRAVIEPEKSELLTHVFLAAPDGSKRIQLTRGEKSATAPSFAPDGRAVFFLSDRSGKNNVYRIAVQGGEAELLTDWKGAMTKYAVSPDGKQLVFVGSEEDKEIEKRRKEKTDYKVIGEKPTRHGLWLVSLTGSLPAKPESLVSGEFHVVGFDWSPDSKRIAYQMVPRADAEVARQADVAEVEVATKTKRPIAATAATESSPSYSPDGRWLVYERQVSKNQAGAPSRLVLRNRADDTERELAPTPDDSPRFVGWARDAKSMVISEVAHLRAVLYRVPLDGPAVLLREMPNGSISEARMNDAGTHLGLVIQGPGEPPEAYFAAMAGGLPTRVSAANTAIEKPAFGKTEVITWKGKDGLEMEGLLTLPLNYTAGQRVPMILNIHGGPSGVFTLGFEGGAGAYPIATFASRGYAVLRPNPRGSSGRGAAFRGRVVTDWGGLDYADLMAGVDAVIAKGIADPDKLAVMGWSYGGYMTAWTVTQTNRFKVAAIGAGITDHVSMYGTQDIPSVYEDYFGGPPWEKPEVYAKSSPIRYVQNVKTPTLIQHGENDNRVPLTQAHEFYRALERRNVPVRMVVYPRQGHGVTEPKLQRQVMEEHLAWVDKYLKN